MNNSICPLIAGLLVSLAVLSVGCTRETPIENEAPKKNKNATMENGESQLISYDYDIRTKSCILKTNLFVLQKQGRPVEFRLRTLWRYDVGDTKWVRLQMEPVKVSIEKKDASDLNIAKLSLDIGLYWLAWTENDVGYSSLVSCGMRCNDMMIGPPPSGYVVACIPYADHATCAFVPDPRIHCRDTATTASTSTTGKAG